MALSVVRTRVPANIGWFSPGQSLFGGTCLWTTSSGQLVCCSMVTEHDATRGDATHGTRWTDMVCMGEVFEYMGWQSRSLVYHVRYRKPMDNRVFAPMKKIRLVIEDTD